jgi:hypothetical protein
VEWKIQYHSEEHKYIYNYPFILGSDCAGTIEDMGEGVTRFTKGDRVIAYVYFLIPSCSYASQRRYITSELHPCLCLPRKRTNRMHITDSVPHFLPTIPHSPPSNTTPSCRPPTPSPFLLPSPSETASYYLLPSQPLHLVFTHPIYSICLYQLPHHARQN